MIGGGQEKGVSTPFARFYLNPPSKKDKSLVALEKSSRQNAFLETTLSSTRQQDFDTRSTTCQSYMG